MTRTTRRHFLQFAGSALAAIGFNPKDIYVLSDTKATRQGVLTA